jgi:hypothetical protein
VGTSTWPGPERTALDRARRIANDLLAHLPDEEQARYAATAHGVGETWLGERLLMHERDQAITTQEAAALVSVSEDVIRRWACTPHPRKPGRMLLPRAGRQGRSMTYIVARVLEASAEVSRSRRAVSIG